MVASCNNINEIVSGVKTTPLGVKRHPILHAGSLCKKGVKVRGL